MVFNSDEYKSWDETPPQFPEDILKQKIRNF